MFKKYTAEYKVDDMTFLVEVIGESEKFGRKMCLIQPKEGKGQKVVNMASLSKLTKAK